jgi:hypothetical protein
MSKINLMHIPFVNYQSEKFPLITDTGSAIFIPRQHPKQKYADHKRARAKRKNKLKTK